MTGFWQLWDIDTANLLADFDTEAEGLTLVRELLGKGWKAADLSLMYEDPEINVEDLPPAVTGEELARRAEAAGSGSVRRTA